MHLLARYIREYKKEAILAPLFKMLEAIFELLVPLVMAALIDQGIATADGGYVLRMCLLLITFAILGLAFAVTAQFFAAKAAIYTAAKLRVDLFTRIGDMSAATHSKAGTASLITRLTSDINQVQNSINLFLRLFLRSPFIVVGAAIMAATINVKATAVFVVVIALLSLVVAAIMHSTLPIFAQIQTRMESLFLRVSENIEGVRVICAFGNQSGQVTSFNGEALALQQDQKRAGGYSALLNPVTYVMVNLGIVVLLWCGGAWVNSGILAKGSVVALVNYMSQILVELIKLANLIVLLMRGVPSLHRVEEVMALDVDERARESSAVGETSTAGATSAQAIAQQRDLQDDQQRDTTPHLTFSHLSFTYPGGGSPAIEDFSLQVESGQRIGIIGGTGSGKSTLMQLLHHSYDATSGSLILKGQPVAAYSDEELARLMGVVFQQARLFNMTIEENIRMAREGISDQDILDAVAWAQASDVIASKADGLQELVLPNARNLSGGQRQRLTIARALAGKPEIIILDDAASALDAATDAALRKDLAALPWAPTVFVISQRPSAVMDADLIVVMEAGRCVGQGTHQELLEHNQVYQEIYYSQFPKEDGHGR